MQGQAAELGSRPGGRARPLNWEAGGVVAAERCNHPSCAAQRSEGALDPARPHVIEPRIRLNNHGSSAPQTTQASAPCVLRAISGCRSHAEDVGTKVWTQAAPRRLKHWRCPQCVASQHAVHEALWVATLSPPPS
eukprot:365619-Chlamydomonas_euryale.AAC.12